MKLNCSIANFKYYFEKNKTKFLMILIFAAIGIIVGIIISLSTDSYLSLLKSDDNILIDYINGEINFFVEAFKSFKNNFILLLIMFLLTLYYPLSFMCYFLITYQTALLYLTISAIILSFGFTGFLSSAIIVLPVNLVNIVICSFVLILLLNRSKFSKLSKDFKCGFDGTFWLNILVCVLSNFLVILFINLILVLFLKNNIFILF